MNYLRSVTELWCLHFDRCTDCHENLRRNSRYQVTERIDSIVCEETQYCGRCGAEHSHFAYGSDSKDVYMFELSERHPIWHRLFNRFSKADKYPV